MIWRSAVAIAVGVLTVIAASVGIIVWPALSGQVLGRTRTASLPVGAIVRTYRVYRPPSVTGRPGLVIDLHGTGTGGFLEEAATRFDAQADRYGWIVAYPDATAIGWEAYGKREASGIDDVAFVERLIDRLRATDGVDPDRVYVTGLSRGGEMAYRLGCELAPRVAAIAPVEGNMADENGDVSGVACHPPGPVSVLAVHGTADSAIPIRGGGGFAPLSDVIGRWRALDGCAASPTIAVQGRSTTTAWSCRGGAEVRSVVVQGSGHVWPGEPLTGVPWGPAESVDATRLISAFFAAHRRATTT